MRFVLVEVEQKPRDPLRVRVHQRRKRAGGCWRRRGSSTLFYIRGRDDALVSAFILLLRSLRQGEHRKQKNSKVFSSIRFDNHFIGSVSKWRRFNCWNGRQSADSYLTRTYLKVSCLPQNLLLPTRSISPTERNVCRLLLCISGALNLAWQVKLRRSWNSSVAHRKSLEKKKMYIEKNAKRRERIRDT